MTKFRPFRCGACGGQVVEEAGPGRQREYRHGVPIDVPPTFKIPTCTECGEEYMSVEDAERLDAAQKPLFLAWQRTHLRKVVDQIITRHSASLREIERVCGVTGTYLSHVLAGRKEASTMLVRLLEAYSVAPAEYVRQRDGAPWTPHKRHLEQRARRTG